MKTQLFLAMLSISFLQTGCFFPNNDAQETSNDAAYSETNTMIPQEYEQQNSMDKSNDADNQRTNGITYFKNYDPKANMVSSTIPFPSSWKQLTNNREFKFEGPNNLKVSGEFGRNFTYGQYGGNNRPPMSLQQIIQEFFMPTAQQTNRTLLTTYELPRVAQVTQNYRDRLWKYAPSQQTTKAYALEWKDTNGMKYITVINVINDQSQFGSYWGFYGNYLQARSQDFEAAKKAFIHGLENTQYNPQWIAAFNQKEMQRANVSNAAHQQRMAAINARGNAILETGKIYSEISDISHAGYLNRSNINSHGHSKTISGINETITIANHNSGEHYSVPMGNKYYWVGKDGTYFGTDNSLYNPNTDQRMNSNDWTQFEIEQ